METVNNLADKSGTEPTAGEQAPSTNSAPTSGSTAPVAKEETNQPPVSGTDTSASARDGPSNAASTDETGDPKSGQKPETTPAGGNDSKGDSLKDKMPHSDEEREKLMESGNFPHDPNDHSGEPLKMHGDSAKGSEDKAEEVESKSEGEGEKKRSDSVAHEGGDPHGSSKGTGQEVVKASGMAADGGDFDATKPGAGSEANRLLEEKGVHKTGGNTGPPETGNDDTAAPKVSKLDKLKEKLHIKH